MNPKQTLEYLETLQPMMLSELLQWVEMESPTTEKSAAERLRSVPIKEIEKKRIEEGSESSRELIEKEALQSHCVFILEPAGPNNSLKTKRRGVGGYKLVTHGKAAHAGVEPEKGVNAIQELAHQILEIQSWNQLRA